MLIFSPTPPLCVTVKLVPPSAPSVSRASDTAVMVHWSVPENDGLPISLFRIQYKEVEPNNGQWQTVDDDISAKSRRYKVSRLKSGECMDSAQLRLSDKERFCETAMM